MPKNIRENGKPKAGNAGGDAKEKMNLRMMVKRRKIKNPTEIIDPRVISSNTMGYHHPM